ncbi:hypothetical protein [uncultured Paraglaciecola sp.]|uniref:hypothetical protein n=1 Tax=uncultured Paraglaciecola sp. TaxID=1765024 RepID=UPI00263952A9|nr:hypothetical protein [uncultured Paraglaciecola sp.]
MVDFSRFNLVPDITPLTNEIRQFNPQNRARREQGMRLAGLQESLLEGQVREQNAEAGKLEAINSAYGAISMFDADIQDIESILTGANEGNIYTRLVGYLGQNRDEIDPDDMQDVADISKQAIDDPAGAIEVLSSRLDNAELMKSKTLQSLQMLGENFGPDVQKAEILEDGTVIFANDDRTVTVRRPGGEVLSGEAAASAIKNSKRFKAEAHGYENALKVATDYAAEVYEKAGPISGSISSLEEGIRLVEEGAETGVFKSRVPTLNQNTLRLRQLANRFGLDIVGQYTFGALSEKELRLAIETGSPPKNLNTSQTKQWFEDRLTAQRKLLTAIEEVASFLGSGNKTIPEWIQNKNDTRRQPAAASASKPPAGVDRVITIP